MTDKLDLATGWRNTGTRHFASHTQAYPDLLARATRRIRALIVICLAWIAFLPGTSHALTLTNLGNAINSAGSLNSGFVLSQAFTTGQAARLTSVTVSITRLANGSTLTVALYDDNAGKPGSLLGTLAGDTDPATGDVTYTATSTLNLAANTTYWFVLAASTGNYLLMATADTSESGDWTGASISNDATVFTIANFPAGAPTTFAGVPYRLSISAAALTTTAVPALADFGVILLASLVMISFAWARRS